MLSIRLFHPSCTGRLPALDIVVNRLAPDNASRSEGHQPSSGLYKCLWSCRVCLRQLGLHTLDLLVCPEFLSLSCGRPLPLQTRPAMGSGGRIFGSQPLLRCQHLSGTRSQRTFVRDLRIRLLSMAGYDGLSESAAIPKLARPGLLVRPADLDRYRGSPCPRGDASAQPILAGPKYAAHLEPDLFRSRRLRHSKVPTAPDAAVHQPKDRNLRYLFVASCPVSGMVGPSQVPATEWEWFSHPVSCLLYLHAGLSGIAMVDQENKSTQEIKA